MRKLKQEQDNQLEILLAAVAKTPSDDTFSALDTQIQIYKKQWYNISNYERAYEIQMQMFEYTKLMHRGG